MIGLVGRPSKAKSEYSAIIIVLGSQIGFTKATIGEFAADLHGRN